jgi:hypothetical protein
MEEVLLCIDFSLEILNGHVQTRPPQNISNTLEKLM